ncbi:hypothetical protein DQ354_12355 [Arthrobacter sp. AQ5-06]|nr:hypothetical protein DQ354_12355 [Arthrobacter sp. AQ5-06]
MLITMNRVSLTDASARDARLTLPTSRQRTLFLRCNTSRRTGRRVLAEAGGVRPRRGRDLKGRCLTFAQREEIAVLRAQGQSLRQIGAVVGRSASTVSRELRRNSVAGLPYRATSAHALAYRAGLFDPTCTGLLPRRVGGR